MDGERLIPWPGRRLPALSADLRRRVAAVALGLLVAAALVIVARRLAGALTTPLGPSVLFLIGTTTVAAAAAIRVAWRAKGTVPFSLTRKSGQSPVPRFDRAVMIATSLAVAVLGVGVCVPGTPALGMVVLGAFLGVEEVWAWTWYVPRRVPLAKPAPPLASPLSRVPLAEPVPLLVPPDRAAAVFPEEVTQQLTRSQSTDGAEGLSGWLRSAFAAGQRTGSIHVAFCPPFAESPELEVEQLDGPEARIKTAQLLPYGVRLDLKLAAASEGPTTVLLQFSARTGQKA